MTSKTRIGRVRFLALGAGVLLATSVVLVLFCQACANGPPRNLDDLCEIFEEKGEWYEGAMRSFERWGVSPSVQLAFIHQESRFRADARPGWRRVLWIIPVGRRSSAYGYGQVKDGTWADYVRATGRGNADRSRFPDVADFIGWYGDVIHRRNAVAKDDTFLLYLAYHEGPGGFARRTHQQKPWLLGVARKVEARARLYQIQHLGCRDELAEAH